MSADNDDPTSDIARRAGFVRASSNEAIWVRASQIDVVRATTGSEARVQRAATAFGLAGEREPLYSDLPPDELLARIAAVQEWNR